MANFSPNAMQRQLSRGKKVGEIDNYSTAAKKLLKNAA
jgi:hypothetical protein